jgi:hypothetical protein
MASENQFVVNSRWVKTQPYNMNRADGSLNRVYLKAFFLSLFKEP